MQKTSQRRLQGRRKQKKGTAVPALHRQKLQETVEG
jgi:hypothetical protein